MPLASLPAPAQSEAARPQTAAGRAAHAEAILAILKARADAAAARSEVMRRGRGSRFARPDECSARVDPP